jgi:hypothetical protein
MPMFCVFGSVCLFYIILQHLNPQQICECNFTYIGICIIITTVILLSLSVLSHNYSVQYKAIFFNQVVPRSFAGSDSAEVFVKATRIVTDARNYLLIFMQETRRQIVRLQVSAAV